MDNLSISPNIGLQTKLKDIDTRSESIYLSALYVLNDYENQDRIGKSAHSFRELTIILFRPEFYSVEVEESKDKKTNICKKNSTDD